MSRRNFRLETDEAEVSSAMVGMELEFCPVILRRLLYGNPTLAVSYTSSHTAHRWFVFQLTNRSFVAGNLNRLRNC